MSFEPVIGLEVHVQLATRSKLFCACANEYGAPPNAHVCAVCTGQPGALPVLNGAALDLAVTAGLALSCAIASRIRFDRKNYFYPDLPKGYQITQLAAPVCGAGGIEIEGDDGARRTIRIVRAHLEEDAGKTMHPDGAAYSLVDLNRAGVPLLEIVSAPDLRSPAEAWRYLDQLKRLLRYARASECDMEKGSLRCDANVSIRARGQTALGTRVEIKNLNSFRNVERALEHEIARQTSVVASGGAVAQETRSWRADSERTEPLRSKEEAEDYRYFEEPDLPETAVAADLVARRRAALPEFPAAKAERYRSQLALPESAIEVLVAEREHAAFFERCLAKLGAGANAPLLANFVVGGALAQANERGVPIESLALAPEALAEVVALVAEGRVSQQAARGRLLPALIGSPKSAAALVAELGLEQVSDRADLLAQVDAAIAAQPKAAAEYRAGKAAALNSLVGAVMKQSRGKANPNLVKELLEERLRA